MLIDSRAMLPPIRVLASVALGVLLTCCFTARTRTDISVDSPEAAAELAADIANRKCAEIYGTRPFDASTWKAYRNGDRWVWGKLDYGRPDGYSAIVSFDLDGSAPEVQVMFFEDTLRSGRIGHIRLKEDE
jgi:hypothetical protein